MEYWPVARRWAILAIILWTVVISTIGWWLLHDLHRERRQQDAASIRFSALAAAHIVSASHWQPSGETLEAWRELESELHCTLTLHELPIDSPGATALEPMDSKLRSDLSEVDWADEPGGLLRISAEAPLSDTSTPAQFIRASRLVTDYGSSISEHWWGLMLIWLTGSTLMMACLYVPWNGLKQVIQGLEEWTRAELRRPNRANVPMVFHFPAEMSTLLGSVNSALTHIDHELHSSIASGEQAMNVLSGMSEGVVAVDEQQRILFINPSGRRLLDIPFVDCIGKVFFESIRLPKVASMIQQALQLEVHQRSSVLEETLELGSISKRVLRLRATRLLGHNGRNGALITISDETRLHKLENLRRDFTANVSHELKTPLAAIKAYTETLLLGALDDHEHSRRFVERIGEQSGRLEALIHDLLKLARLQDSPQLRLDRVRLVDVVRQSVESCAAIGKSNQVVIQAEPISDSIELLIDREAIATILNNLLSNAVRYTQPGGRVEVSAQHRDGELHLQVVDTGIGIAPEEHERIFERFYRVDKARSADSGGTGLGLAIVKNLVTLLGGSIELRSALGKGSSFQVRVPAKRA